MQFNLPQTLNSPIIISPQKGVQELFVASHQVADITVYGGSAGGGKSWGLCFSALQFVKNSEFRGVFLRGDKNSLFQGGGLWDESKKIYSKYKEKLPNGNYVYAKPLAGDEKWVFPSGAEIHFRYLDHNNMEKWKGMQYDFIGFDELTEYTLDTFSYMFTRLRGSSGVKSHVKCTTNPDKNSWVRDFLDWWIDSETGYAIPSRSGKIKWFIRVNNNFVWGNTKEELKLLYPDFSPKSLMFIRASVDDNQKLLENNPEYKANLQMQNAVEYAKLCLGNWNVDYSTYGSCIKEEDFPKYDFDICLKKAGFFTKVYFVVDTASKLNSWNDYTTIGLYGKSRWDKNWYIINMIRKRLRFDELVNVVNKEWDFWRKLLQENFHVPPFGIYIENMNNGQALIDTIRRAGIPAFELKTKQKDKYSRFYAVQGFIKANMVLIPNKKNWISVFIEECECFRADLDHALMKNEKKPHDDQVDNLVYALSDQINNNMNAPKFSSSGDVVFLANKNNYIKNKKYNIYDDTY